MPMSPRLLSAAIYQSDLDRALKPIMDALGIETGDIAAQVISRDRWRSSTHERRRILLGLWLQQECVWGLG